MSTFFEIRDRRVIPNFRQLSKTVKLGELGPLHLSDELFQKDDITTYCQDFANQKSIATAGDLISAAIVNNTIDLPEVVAATNFILENRGFASEIQITIAEKLLNIGISRNNSSIDSIDDLLELESLPLIHQRIKKLRNEVRQFQGNPFLYVELARLYSIIGQKDSALRNMIIAKSLVPHNRYVLRSYARLMSHFGDLEQAHDILRKNNTTKFDPWLLASEIAFSSLLNKSSNFLKAGNEMVSSKNFSPFNISELASSIGTVELMNGSRKKSKILLQTALVSPNDNSLAQIEWINNKENFFELEVANLEVDNKFEALTLDSYDSQNWESVIRNSEKWFIDMPFAKRPIMFGHHTASLFLEDQETAIKFCKAGLISNPNDPQLINNIAYSYAMNNQPKLSFEQLNKIDINSVKEDHTRICLLATTGLAYFRSGFPEYGRDLYLRAINEAKQKEQRYYATMALLNVVREEMLLKTEFAKDLYEQAINVDVGGNIEFEILKDRIKSLKEKLNLW